MLIATAIVVLIMAAGMYAVSTMLEAGVRSTESSLTDTDKRLEEVDPEFQFDGQILLTNAGGEEAEIVMMRFYDSDGAIAYRAIMDDGTGRNFTGYDTTLTPMSMPVGGQKSLGLADLPDLGGFERADVVTSYGNVFTVDLPVVGGYGPASWNGTDGGWTVPGPDGEQIPVGPDGGVNGTGFGGGPGGGGDAVGTAMGAGLGVSARLVYHDVPGKVIYGTGTIGTEQSLRPYIQLPAEAEYVAVISDDGIIFSRPIPYSYHDYTLNQYGVLNKPNPSNTLGYTDSRTIHGDIAASSTGDGITVSGEGRLILRLTDVAPRTLVHGIAAEGTTVRVVESPYDLMTLPFSEGRFLISHTQSDPGTDSLQVLAGSVDDSVKSCLYEFTQSASLVVYHGKCCKGRYIQTGSHDISTTPNLRIASHPSGYLAVTGDDVTAWTMDPNSITRPGGKILRTNYNNVGNHNHYIYDTLPAKLEGHVMRGSFTAEFDGLQNKYLVIDSTQAGQSVISAYDIQDRDFLRIDGIDAGTVYRVTSGQATIGAGISEGSVTIDSFSAHVQREELRLWLYNEALVHRHAGGQQSGLLIMDRVNSESFRIPGTERTAYTPHAYVKIPVPSQVEVSGITLDEIPLSYLDGRYGGGDAVMIPVIPAYETIHLSINGVGTSINIADVLGVTGLRITDPTSSTITVSQDAFIGSIESTTGIMTYAVAVTDGQMKAHVQASVSGESEITNTRTFENIPIPPPPPRPRDPLTAWLEVYINGQRQQIDGAYRMQIFFSETPATDHEAGLSGQYATYHTARFAYPEVRIFDTVSVPVSEGDFVEFYFYNQIRADGSNPPLPAGFRDRTQHGQASATASIQFASINTSM